MDRYGPIAAYYSARAAAYGPSPLGVDWTCVATQQMRFVQLLTVCDDAPTLSINDVGCGYAALRGFMAEFSPATSVDYLGIDVSAAMVELARAELARFADADAVIGASSPRVADYSVASGIFNVCLDYSRDDWETMIGAALRDLLSTSRRGCAVNFLAPRAGPPSPGLYRAEVAPWTEFCRQELGADVAVVAGYGMDEFTLLLR